MIKSTFSAGTSANYPCVLTIAGTDPSGGAGIQADIKTISATGSYATSVITALVAQNTQGVQAIEIISADFIMQQLESVFTDLDIAAVKIGMLHNAQTINIVASALKQFKPNHIVFDPVMVAKNGCALLKSDVISLIKETVFPLADLITPNIFEAEKIINSKIKTTAEMESAAKNISNAFNTNVLLKGGHLKTAQSSDVMYYQELNSTETLWFHAERIDTKNTHGTGCTLSAAIASYLAQGYSMLNAIAAAKKYLTNAIQAGKEYHIGHGCGPVDHFYFLR